MHGGPWSVKEKILPLCIIQSWCYSKWSGLVALKCLKMWRTAKGWYCSKPLHTKWTAYHKLTFGDFKSVSCMWELELTLRKHLDSRLHTTPGVLQDISNTYLSSINCCHHSFSSHLVVAWNISQSYPSSQGLPHWLDEDQRISDCGQNSTQFYSSVPTWRNLSRHD